jgi:hypothetical protein
MRDVDRLVGLFNRPIVRMKELTGTSEQVGRRLTISSQVLQRFQRPG